MVTSKSKTKKKRKTKTKPSVVETTFQDLKEVQKIKISDLKVKNKLYSFLASIIFIFKSSLSFSNFFSIFK